MTTVLTKSFPLETRPAATAVPSIKGVLIVGGGFAGIAAARALKRADVQNTLIDRRNDHIFQPSLYQIATAALSAAEIAVPIRQLEAKQDNLSVLPTEVKGIDLGTRIAETICRGVGDRKLEYESLAIATGMRPGYFGCDEFARFAPGLKSLNDTEAIQTQILGASDLAESTSDPRKRAQQMTFVLVGGGPTGFEVAASIAQLAWVTLHSKFRKVDGAMSRILLLDGGARILPTIAESLSQSAANSPSKLGVEISTGVKIKKVDDQRVIAAGLRIPSATVIWTAGVSDTPVVRSWDSDRRRTACVRRRFHGRSPGAQRKTRCRQVRRGAWGSGEPDNRDGHGPSGGRHGRAGFWRRVSKCTRRNI